MKRFLKTSALLISAVLFSGCYTWFETKTPMGGDSKIISLEDLMYEPSRITALNPPEQVLVSQGLYSGSIKSRIVILLGCRAGFIEAVNSVEGTFCCRI